ncbi:RBBP9/YdeN family alpha/beta hydrolase [Kitasatospora sp. NPDC006697]|uniref:RBBP9/YdeN family alpha/beta hydrolase n=1 Tax=Kitasatospora sp. NPDC006697 TaxID=3364020 RepID=UPI003688D462
MTIEPKAFLLLHGYRNHRPPGHWQHWLAGELSALGHAVDYPQLPDPDRPDPERWLAELRDRPVLPWRERVVVCHSLGCLLWLRAAAVPHCPPADRLLLVAPPSPGVLAGIPEIAAFAAPRPLPALPPSTRLVLGEGDPYGLGGAEWLGPLDTDLVPAGAHLNPDSGYGRWPAVLDWCLDPAVRITARPDPSPARRPAGTFHHAG